MSPLNQVYMLLEYVIGIIMVAERGSTLSMDKELYCKLGTINWKKKKNETKEKKEKEQEVNKQKQKNNNLKKKKRK